MVVLEEDCFKTVVGDLGFPITGPLYKELMYIELYLQSYGILLNTNFHFLNLYELRFNDEKAEFMFKLKYSNLINPKFQ